MAWILLCKTIKLVLKKICYNFGDIEFFLRDFLLAHPVDVFFTMFHGLYCMFVAVFFVWTRTFLLARLMGHFVLLAGVCRRRL